MTIVDLQSCSVITTHWDLNNFCFISRVLSHYDNLAMKSKQTDDRELMKHPSALEKNLFRTGYNEGKKLWKLISRIELSLCTGYIGGWR